jgi:RsmE family RNA methyltransferase
LPVRDPRAIHLLKTLHKTSGDTFTAGLLGGKRGTGTITSLAPLAVILTLNEEPLHRFAIRLGVGFARPIQLRRIFREASNFGLESVSVFGCSLGDKSYLQTTLFEDGGAQQAMIEGAVEARDTRLPALRRFGGIDGWLAALDEEDALASYRRIALDNVNAQGSFFDAVRCRMPEGAGVTLAVGSERGWSDGERALLEKSGFIRLSIGERALRTETACIAAIILATASCSGRTSPVEGAGDEAEWGGNAAFRGETGG